MSTQRPVYLDHAATTPVREEVRAAMDPYLSGVFGNPSSLHRWGREASAALEDARAEIAHALGAQPSEIRFVRGGTESDNLAVQGSCRAIRSPGGPLPVLAISTIEHSAVLEAADHLAQRDEARVVRIGVRPEGIVDADALREALDVDAPGLVSMMWVNNETGLILPVDEVADVASDAGALVHSDASQAVGKVPVDVREVPVDLLTATGHKINGPRGMGILYVRRGTPIAPLLHGGGQERSLRPGTEDVAGAVGLATAIRLAVDELHRFAAHVGTLRARLEAELRAAIPGLRVNCAEGPRAPHVSSVGIPGVRDGQALLMALGLEGVAVSGGSACHSGAGKASHVIAALYGPADDRTTVRFSYGRSSAAEEVDRAVDTVSRVVRRVRSVA